MKILSYEEILEELLEDSISNGISEMSHEEYNKNKAIALQLFKEQCSRQKTISCKQIKFSCNEYVRTHGKAPKGRGKWIFDYARHDEILEFEAYGTLTEAKQQCMRHIKTMFPADFAAYVTAHIRP